MCTHTHTHVHGHQLRTWHKSSSESAINQTLIGRQALSFWQGYCWTGQSLWHPRCARQPTKMISRDFHFLVFIPLSRRPFSHGMLRVISGLVLGDPGLPLRPVENTLWFLAALSWTIHSGRIQLPHPVATPADLLLGALWRMRDESGIQIDSAVRCLRSCSWLRLFHLKKRKGENIIESVLVKWHRSWDVSKKVSGILQLQEILPTNDVTQIRKSFSAWKAGTAGPKLVAKGQEARVARGRH